MRVALIGRANDRARLRSLLEAAGVQIVREAAALSASDVADLEAEVLVLASPDDGGHGAARVPAETLTPREIEVLQLLAEGLPNKRIAALLGISDQTVKFHVAAICGKLEAANRTDAVRRAVRRGLIVL
ncbi:MAG TPA: LuxR C-terminal-related transcriptional regulator [Vicinamibacterales bacterium]|jgi:DNA-binding NarL/FixJ family response regulator